MTQGYGALEMPQKEQFYLLNKKTLVQFSYQFYLLNKNTLVQFRY